MIDKGNLLQASHITQGRGFRVNRVPKNGLPSP